MSGDDLSYLLVEFDDVDFFFVVLLFNVRADGNVVVVFLNLVIRNQFAEMSFRPSFSER